MYHPYDNSDNMSKTYLNAIHDNSCGADGFIESNINGPDISFTFPSLPFKSLKQLNTKLQDDIGLLYNILPRSFYHKNKRNPFKSVSL